MLPLSSRFFSSYLNRSSLFSILQKHCFTIGRVVRQEQWRTRSEKEIPVDTGKQQEMVLNALRGGARPQLRENVSFHEGDGLKSNDWTLIYKNSGTAYLCLMVTVYSFVCAVLIGSGAQEVAERRKKLKDQNRPTSFTEVFNRDAALFLVSGFAILASMIRYRRCWVIRLYEKNVPKHGKPPPALVLSADSPPPKRPPPVREYCVVWMNLFWRRRLHFYKSDEAFRAKESPPIVANIWGNFVARNRSFAVFQHNFEDPLDYYRVRGKNVVGRMFVA